MNTFQTADDAGDRRDKRTTARVFLGWLVHAYTASGLIVAAWIASILMRPDVTPDDVRVCFLLMVLATAIDATDGAFARMVKIKETIPSFDGRRLDDITDFFTYACLPLWLIDRTGLLPDGHRWVVLVPLIASAYGFCQTNIKSADGSFIGFPSYWNIVAFFLYVTPVAGWAAVAVLVGFSVLTFVPSRYPYPTQPGILNRVMLGLAVPWGVALVASVWEPWPERPAFSALKWWALAGYPLFYLIFAWASSLRRA